MYPLPITLNKFFRSFRFLLNMNVTMVLIIILVTVVNTVYSRDVQLSKLVTFSKNSPTNSYIKRRLFLRERDSSPRTSLKIKVINKKMRKRLDRVLQRAKLTSEETTFNEVYLGSFKTIS